MKSSCLLPFDADAPNFGNDAFATEQDKRGGTWKQETREGREKRGGKRDTKEARKRWAVNRGGIISIT